MSYLGGADISRWQGDINWQAFDPGTNFALIKASGGDDGIYTDSKFAANRDGARGLGDIGVGFYHFAGGGDPVNEANYFINVVSPLREGEVLILDWEIQHANPVDWCNAFVNRIHEATGVWPLLYINASTCNAYDWNSVLANCGLYIADYAVSPDANVPIHHPYVMHQYNDRGTFPGIAGYVDSDAFFGTLDQFKKYGWHNPTPPAPTPAPAPAVPAPIPAPPVVETPPTPIPAPKPVISPPVVPQPVVTPPTPKPVVKIPVTEVPPTVIHTPSINPVTVPPATVGNFCRKTFLERLYAWLIKILRA